MALLQQPPNLLGVAATDRSDEWFLAVLEKHANPDTAKSSSDIAALSRR